MRKYAAHTLPSSYVRRAVLLTNLLPPAPHTSRARFPHRTARAGPQGGQLHEEPFRALHRPRPVGGGGCLHGHHRWHLTPSRAIPLSLPASAEPSLRAAAPLPRAIPECQRSDARRGVGTAAVRPPLSRAARRVRAVPLSFRRRQRAHRHGNRGRAPSGALTSRGS